MSSPHDRTYYGSGCPFCLGSAATDSNCLATTYPHIAKQWHVRKNGKLTPKDVKPGSEKKVYWQCPIFEDHVFRSPIVNRTKKGSGCPKCTAYRTPKERSLETLFPKVAKQWHRKKNAPVSPSMVGAKSNKKFWWICPLDKGHEFQSRVADRTLSGSGCPICSGNLIIKENSLAAINPLLAKQWHKTKNGSLKPSSVAPSSNKHIWWQCSTSRDHVWQATPDRRNGRNDGCPFCSNKRVSKTNSLKHLFPQIATEWHPTKNGSLTPEDIVAGSGRKVYWRCNKNQRHIWQAQVCNRTVRHGLS